MKWMDWLLTAHQISRGKTIIIITVDEIKLIFVFLSYQVSNGRAYSGWQPKRTCGD